MTIRTNRKMVKFNNPFLLEGVDRLLPAGDYEVVTDEELIEGMSFPAYRRVAAMIIVPAQVSSVEMFNIDPLNLAAAIDRDTQTAFIKTGAGPERAL